MKLARLYIDSYKGLSRPAWVLASVLLINRTGTLVLPFLSLYLKENLNFSLAQIGSVLAAFGFGSLVGSFLGGWLTDRLGAFAVQTGSLFGAGICFLILKEVETFHGLIIGFFITTVIADSLRPANSTAVAEYAKPENLTRAYSLNRMAINLGFSIGPAVGGLLAARNYELLFYADGFTCIAAGLVFAFYFGKRKRRKKEPVSEEVIEAKKNPWQDFNFLFFLLFVAGYGLVFFQLFNTLPLYYRDVYNLSENHIGLLLALNGLLVFLIEMPLVKSLGNNRPVHKIVAFGAVLAGLAYFSLTLAEGLAILVFSMIALSLSEILAMPYMTTFTVNRAGKSSRGKYLGLYSVGYGIAFIAAPAVGTFLIDFSGFTLLWNTMGIIAIAIAFGLLKIMSSKATETEK